MTLYKKNKNFFSSLSYLSCLLLLVLSCNSARGQTSWKFEHYSYFNCGLRQSFTLSGRQALNDRMGFNTYVTVKNNMGGGSLGLDYKFAPWLQAGVLGGWDIQLSSVVFIPYLAVKVDKVTFTAAYLRIGEVLDLYELALMYEGKSIKAGVMARNYFGVGPRIDVRIPNTPLYCWLGGLYEWKKENYGLMAGLIIPFSTYINK